MPRSAPAVFLLLLSCAGERSLDLTAHDYGVSFGNSRVTHGLRINAVDAGVEQVDGVNLTLWRPGDNEDAVMRGLGVGLYGPDGHQVTGLSIGPLVAGDALTGVQLGLLGAKSRDSMHGLNLASVVTRAERDLFGVNGALMVGGGGDVGFLNLGVLGISPFRLSDLSGPHQGLLWGLNVGGIFVDYPNASGLTVSGVVRVPRIDGLSIAYGWHQSSHLVRGVTIAPVNFAHDLHGVQLGLLNYVGSNPPWLRWLPLANARF